MRLLAERHTQAFLLSLYALELSLVLIGLAFRRLGYEGLATPFATKTGTMAVGATALLGCAGAVVLWCLRRLRERPREILFSLVLNMIGVTVCLAGGEISVRLLARKVLGKTQVRNTVLLPQSWEELRRFLVGEAAKLTELGSVTGYDPELGWTVRRSYTSPDGMYVTSREGIRSELSGITMLDRRPRVRVALVGDSFTFADEVFYRESWGARLEEGLGREYQVLNLGVPGYGTDQALLRFQRDVRPLRPDWVIVGVLPHDLVRSLTFYPFLTWSPPLVRSKPRVMEATGGWSAITPRLSEQEVLERPTPESFPYLERDRLFNPDEWRWNWYDRFYLVRFLKGAFAPGAMGLDGRSRAEIFFVLKTLDRVVREAGARPLFVLMVAGYAMERDALRLDALEMFREGGLESFDLTASLLEVPERDRYAPKGHYSPAANRAVATALKNYLLHH